jgi:hypothetical protein
MDVRPATADVQQTGEAAGTPADSLFSDTRAPAAGLPDVADRTPRRSRVHTLETNVGPQGKPKPPTRLEREEMRREREATTYFKNRGFHRELAGTVIPPPTALELDYRHGWWSEDRERIRRALYRGGFPQARIERFENCGSAAFVHVHKQHHTPRISANCCRDRFCKPCAVTNSRLIGGNLADRLADRRWGRFTHMVFTLKSRRTPLSVEIDRLYAAFKRLRGYRLGTVPRTKKHRGRMVNWWSWHVRGGAAFCQVTLNLKDDSPDYGLWHVHMHVIAAARFIDKAAIESLWKIATGDSYVVELRAIDSREAAAAEVASYAARGVEKLDELGPEKLDELIRAFSGRRLCFTFGEWRGWRLTATPVFNPDEWVTVGRLDEIIERADAGDDWARSIVQLLERPPPA